MTPLGVVSHIFNVYFLNYIRTVLGRIKIVGKKEKTRIRIKIGGKIHKSKIKEGKE